MVVLGQEQRGFDERHGYEGPGKEGQEKGDREGLSGFFSKQCRDGAQTG